ncbi:uncharacterized protein AB9X84_005512 [Acanthopagrus schlegelii]
MAMFVTGESLTCNTCQVSLAGKCRYKSTETCSDSETNCYWGKLGSSCPPIQAFNNTRLRILNMETGGCLNSTRCNQTEAGVLLTAGYTITRTCCSTADLCNGAPSIQLPLTAALGAAVMAIWSTRGL